MNINTRWIRCLLVSVVLGAFPAMPTGWAATFNVSIGSNFFSPASSTINVNDTVLWTWSGNNHSTTSTSGLWESGVHNTGFTYSRQFTAAGSFPYRCSVHASMTGSITVQAANTPPTVTISNPTNGAVFTAPASFTFAADASDPGGSVTQVEFFRDTTSLGMDAGSPYSVPVSGLAAGSYTLTAVATDNRGAKATNSVAVIVNALPTVSIASPTNGTILAAPFDGAIQANAEDSDGSIHQVDFYADSTALGSVPETQRPAGGAHELALSIGHHRHGVADELSRRRQSLRRHRRRNPQSHRGDEPTGRAAARP